MYRNKTTVLFILCSIGALLCSCGNAKTQTKSKEINTRGGVGKEYLASSYGGMSDYVANNVIAFDYAHVYADLNNDGYEELFFYWTLDGESWHTQVYSIDDQGVFLMKNERVEEDLFIPVGNGAGEYRLVWQILSS